MVSINKKRTTPFYILLLGIVSWVLILPGCSQDTSTNIVNTRTENDPSLENNTTPEETINSKDIDQPLINKDSLTSMISSMTLEQKVAQLFIVDFFGMTGSYDVNEYSSSISNFLADYPIGGIIYFADNIIDSKQLISLNTQLQENTSIPLFISVDEEGGLVSRLGKKNIGVTALPSAIELQENYTESEVEALAEKLGEELIDFGFNMNFAPVLDVNTNPNNPVIGNRAFSDDAQIVASYGCAFMTGLNNASIISVGKHFPGHGDTSTDSHFGLAQINSTLDDLKQIEWIPFHRAIKEGIPAIMMGHITTPNITSDGLPSSLSKEMISQLRDFLGFNGLLITDSLRMGAITDYYSDEEIGVLVLEAGCDLILIPNDFQKAYQGILSALDSGRLTEARIDESLLRILSTKESYKIVNFY